MYPYRHLIKYSRKHNLSFKISSMANLGTLLPLELQFDANHRKNLRLSKDLV